MPPNPSTPFQAPSAELPMTTPTLPPFRPDRIVPAAMIASVALLGLTAVLVAEAPAQPLPELGVWFLAATGAAMIAGGVFLRAIAERSAGSGNASALSPRLLGALALQEAGGIVGAVLTLLTGSPLWAAALGIAAVAGLALALART